MPTSTITRSETEDSWMMDQETQESQVRTVHVFNTCRKCSVCVILSRATRFYSTFVPHACSSECLVVLSQTHVWLACYIIYGFIVQADKPDMDILDYLDHDPGLTHSSRNITSSPDSFRLRPDSLTNHKVSLDWAPRRPTSADSPKMRPHRMFQK